MLDVSMTGFGHTTSGRHRQAIAWWLTRRFRISWPGRRITSCGTMVAWGWLSYWQAGPVWGGLFVVSFVVINIVLARAVCEGGVIHVECWWPFYLAMWVFGIRSVGVRALLMLGMVSIIASNDLRAGPLPYMLNSGRMAEGCSRMKMSRLFTGMALSLVIAFGVGTFSHLSLETHPSVDVMRHAT